MCVCVCARVRVRERECAGRECALDLSLLLPRHILPPTLPSSAPFPFLLTLPSRANGSGPHLALEISPPLLICFETLPILLLFLLPPSIPSQAAKVPNRSASDPSSTVLGDIPQDVLPLVVRAMLPRVPKICPTSRKDVAIPPQSEWLHSRAEVYAKERALMLLQAEVGLNHLPFDH